MGRVLTNATGLRCTVESAIGVAGTQWFVVEFESIGAYGAVITTVARRPIGLSRGRKKGAVTDLESSAEYETDLTIDAVSRFAEGFFFAEYANVEFDLRASSGTVPPPAVTDGYTIDSASAILAGKMQWVTASYGTLVYAKGYAIAANNGVKVLTADVASTDTTVTVAGQGVVAETPPTNASLQVCGVRILDDADLTLTVSGSTATLVSAAAIADWATLGIFPGMYIHVGGIDTDGTVARGLGAGGTTSYGYARVVSVSGDTINLDKLDENLSTATGPAGASQDVLFGRFARNVQVTADATDNRYLERTYQFEVSYPNLGAGGVEEYEYSIGNFVNEFSLNLPLTNKATVSFGFIGTNSDPITDSRKTGASGAVAPLRTTAFSTAVDLVSITTDLISSISDVCFKSLTMSFLNNVSPEKCLGVLGASFVNAGLFEANIEGQMLFTTKEIVNAIRSNQTVTMAAILRNEDGALAWDVPEMTLGGGGREYPVDQSVLVNVTGQSFTSNQFGHDASLTIFPVVPQAA